MYIFPYKSISKQIWSCGNKPKSWFEQTLLGPSPQCCIPISKVIRPLVPEKKNFKGFLPYMGVVAILVMWPRPQEQTFVPPFHGDSTWNLDLTDPAVSDKMFENGGHFFFLFGFYGQSRLFHWFWAESIIRWGEKRSSPIWYFQKAIQLVSIFDYITS